MRPLDDRVVIVTGAARGMGQGTAKYLAQVGAKVVIADVLEEGVAETVSQIKAAGESAVGVVCDVTKPSDIDRMLDTAMQEFGQFDVLVNNAGVVVAKGVLDQTDADWDFVMSVNTKGLFFACQAAVRLLLKQDRPGAIVNIASVAGMHYTLPHVPYAASKAGVIAITRDLAYEVAGYGIRVNAVAPGPIFTPMVSENHSEEWIQEFPNRIPLRRWGQPEDIGKAVAFLASDESGFITGHTIPVAGGAELRAMAV